MLTMQERIERLPTKTVLKPIDRDTFYDAYNRYADRECTLADVAKACGASYQNTIELVYATALGYPLPKYQFTDEWTDEHRAELKKKCQERMEHASKVRLERLAKEKANNGK